MPPRGAVSFEAGRQAMEGIRILVANEPRSYREVLAAALRKLRAHVKVIVVEPDDVDAEVVLQRPHLVLCSRLTAPVQSCLLGWVVLYPDGARRAVVNVGGQRTVMPDLELANVLAIVDQAQRLAARG